MTIIRSAPKFIALLTFFGFAICWPGIDALYNGLPIGIAYIALGLALCVVPIARYKVSFDNYALTFRGMFSTRSVRFNEVGSFSVSGSSFSPEHELRIFGRGTDRPVLVVNLKPFSKDDIESICMRLETAKSSSTFSPS